MITAILLAGGIGQRMGKEIPKQFIEVEGKPILAYTVDKFQRHHAIDRIVVVCVPGWEDYVCDMARLYGISKLTAVVPGGETALSSIKNGIDVLNCQDDDIIVVHDGVRPLVDENSIDSVIEDCKIYGGAISSIPLIEHIVFEGENRTDLKYIPRERAYRTITPQAYTYGRITSAYRRAAETGIGKDSSFIGTMMLDLGERVCLSKGSEDNIKITTPVDLIHFKTMIHLAKDNQNNEN